MLAGLFKAPTKFAPHVNLPAARARANDVLNNMVAAGYLHENQIADAQRNPASPVDRGAEASTPDWYLDWAFNEIKALADAGKLGTDRVFTVRTALDSALQKKAEATIDDNAARKRAGLPRQTGRDHRARTARRRARAGRRARLRRQPVQPRHRRAAPAGLVVQALCLSDGPDERQVHAADHSGRRARSASATGARRITAAPMAARCRCGTRWPIR